jgi:hypothetical protein
VFTHLWKKRRTRLSNLRMGESMGESKRRRQASSGDYSLGDGPLDEDIANHMIASMQVLDGYFNNDKKGPDRDIGIVMMIFPFGERAGRCNYISNGADRRDIITLMKQQIKRFEGQPDVEGHA